MSEAQEALAAAFWDEVSQDAVRSVIRGVMARAKTGEPTAVLTLAHLLNGTTPLFEPAALITPPPAPLALLPAAASPPPPPSGLPAGQRILPDPPEDEEPVEVLPDPPDLVALRVKLKEVLTERAWRLDALARMANTTPAWPWRR